jgi:hypothetical protein
MDIAKEANGCNCKELTDVQVQTIKVPRYYVGSIPADYKHVYAVLGITFVEVCHQGVHYFIVRQELLDVVDKLKLY